MLHTQHIVKVLLTAIYLIRQYIELCVNPYIEVDWGANEERVGLGLNFSMIVGFYEVNN